VHIISTKAKVHSTKSKRGRGKKPILTLQNKELLLFKVLYSVKGIRAIFPLNIQEQWPLG
jgi:hypothetical protein